MLDFDKLILEARDEVSSFLDQNPKGTVLIWWATATGKTKLSVHLSQFFDMEVISSDSRQIFRKMDIWTDKISPEIRAQIPHHQIDIVDPDQTYTAGQRKEASDRICDQILERGKVPFIVGGTGLYIDTIYKNFSMPECPPDLDLRAELEQKESQEAWYLYRELSKIDPDEAQKLHPNSIRYLIRALEIFYKTGKTKTEGYIQQPVRHPLLMLGLWRDKESTNQLINARIKEMLKGWLIEEVQGLLDQGYLPGMQSLQTIGYKEVVAYLQGEYSFDKMEELLKRNTHHLAKKQRTRFRRYIAEGLQNPKANVTYKVRTL